MEKQAKNLRIFGFFYQNFSHKLIYLSFSHDDMSLTMSRNSLNLEQKSCVYIALSFEKNGEKNKPV